eukprot:6186351-Pleurochrysis_carterae.AAC.1
MPLNICAPSLSGDRRRASPRCSAVRRSGLRLVKESAGEVKRCVRRSRFVSLACYASISGGGGLARIDAARR